MLSVQEERPPPYNENTEVKRFACPGSWLRRLRPEAAEAFGGQDTSIAVDQDRAGFVGTSTPRGPPPRPPKAPLLVPEAAVAPEPTVPRQPAHPATAASLAPPRPPVPAKPDQVWLYF